MKTKLFMAGALALAFTFVTLGIVSAGEIHHMVAGGLFDAFAGVDLRIANVVPLVALRTNLDELRANAAAMVQRMTGDLDDAAIRSIESEHAGVVTQIRALTMQIRQREAEETPEASPPGGSPTNADALRAAEEARAAESTRAAEINSMAVRAGQPELAEAAIRGNVGVDTFRAQLFNALVDGQPPVSGAARSQLVRDGSDATRAAKVEALSYGLGAPLPQAGPSEAARQFMGRGVVELAADHVGFRSGRVINARDVDDILTRASHATSDFPVIFENAMNRALEGRYALAQPTFKAFARKRNFRDFRPHASVKVGDFPMLQKILENGEIKAGSFKEGKETVSVMSYGRRIHISRAMLINDDLGAIMDLLESYGASVALFEEVTFYAGAFNGHLSDGKPVFHADHANLTAAGTPIDVANVGKGRAAMGKQKSLDDNPLLRNSPRFILTGPDRSTDAEKLVASVSPHQAGDVNPFSGKLTPIETSQIEGNAWHLIGDPSLGSNWRWGYLEGYEAPRIRMEEPFGSQGFGMSVEHDFGAGPVDFRFAHKNVGAA